MQDPFATPQPAEEAQAETIKPPEPSAPVATAPRPASTSEGKVVVTLKGGTGFDAPWIVIHADDAADALSQINEEMAALMERAQTAAKHFGSLGGGPNTNGARPVAQGQPQGSLEAPAWAPPKPFEDFVYKTGVSAKNGRVWHAWMPPEKGDSRPAKFFYPN